MDLPSYIWLLLIFAALAFAALFVLAAYSLVRLRQLGQSVREAGREMNEGIKSGQIEALKHAQDQMDRLSKSLVGLQSTLDERLMGHQDLLTKQLTSSSETVAGIKKELGALSEATGQIFELGKDIASLEDILSSPKLRGGVGEIFLERLLDEIFPRKLYETQYSFSNGVIVDAIIHIGDHMVPIDSKFPIEDFRRVLEADETDRSKMRRKFLKNVEKKIDEIASKYILPDEGTFDFALMYIPAENVYYETIVRDETEGEGVDMPGLMSYAVNRRVIPVSPNSFYAYLQVILFGLKGMELEKKGSEILAHLRRLQGELDRFSERYSTLGTHLKNAGQTYSTAKDHLAEIDLKLRNLEVSGEPPALEGD